MSPRILIVDDDPVQRQLLEVLVHRFGYGAETAPGGEAALKRMAAANEPPIDLLILDLVMPDLDGMGVLGRLRDKNALVPVVVQTTNGSIEAVISAMRAGAADFVVKPVGPERLQVAIKNGLRLGALEDEVRRLGDKARGALSFRDIAGGSAEMERVVRLGERAAKSTLPVLLEGETGVGKELVARAIHGASDRRGRPFVMAKCGALPGDFIEPFLFGHEKGAFAGAQEKQPGKFVEAHGGALFLDDIGELPLSAQGGLLRALRDGEVDPVGSKRPVKVDVRVICATKQDLIELVKAGRFREDLYYRLNVHPIGVPTLRQRRDDIGDLARRLCARFSAEEGKRLRGLSAETLNLLAAYDWPGNIRQLENAVFRAVVLADGDELTVAEFPQIAAQVQGFDVRIPPLPELAPLPARREPELAHTGMRDQNVLALLDEGGEMRRLDQLEAEAIRFALAHYRGRMTTMARKLGIGRSTLYRKMKEYGFALTAEEPGSTDRDAAAEPGDEDAA
ncbi:DNA-binding transcriptional response regulator, NtrC family, contains REC, AAA-type ATPase, and a Fis-type DNA-binding domains [Methylocella tundrae]|uniref:DNA-binding transcriptional regulator NtrC n=1 Tax=Methylocella tundrae TaxID=227605 RepID=A0A8B6MDA8_METTU|nr:sigma-54 dependent transcriptional regulator [Methylocella tundrae]VTZ25422.1 DNA-binding transcriptional response regulator, NtrC family, contains REC, AAA-type ATPase, and a Fis-type DNA-binding domains [Methylocella tundrae]VTZ52608.1 DNA-binding transcriptional response regulator, NtrC family, contains REC, AAA-type ATPase, and a Fis-type DNA-binding domains [Methylocella tundrae]